MLILPALKCVLNKGLQLARDQFTLDQFIRDQFTRDQVARDQFTRDQFTRDQFTRDQVTRAYDQAGVKVSSKKTRELCLSTNPSQCKLQFKR